MRVAVILPPSASSFHQVAGLPLIQRTVLSAVRSGFDRVIVLGREHAPRLRQLFARDTRTHAVEVAESVPLLDGEAITLIPSDVLLTPATLSNIGAVTLDGKPLLFGTGGSRHAAVCGPAMLSDIDLSALTADGAAAVWNTLRGRGARSVSLHGELWVPIRDQDSVRHAEAALCERLRADSAASDGPLAHWIDRRISLRISRWLTRHTRLRPNHITVIGTSVGLLAAATLSLGTYWVGLAGTLLFLCATILDGCDGEVARLTFGESPFGQKFDVITDNIVHVAIFIGVALGVYHQNPDGHSLALMALLLGGFACDGVLSYFFLVRRAGFARRQPPPITVKGRLRQRLLQMFEAMMNRDFAYILLVFALCGRLHWFLWGTAFGTYLFALLLVWVYRWRNAE